MNATITYPLNLLIVIIGSFLCIRLTLFLLARQSLKANSNKYLGVLVFILGIPLLVQSLDRFELLHYFPHVIGVHRITLFLVAPLTYLYVRACTQRKFELRPILLLHFLPFVLELVVTIPFFAESAEYKLELHRQFVEEGKLFSSRISIPIKAIHATAYFALSLRIITRYKDYVSNTSSSIDKTFHRWLLFFVFAMAFPIFLTIYVGFVEYDKSLRFLFFLIGYLAFFLSIDIAILLKPQLFQIFPYQTPQPDSKEMKKEKYERSNLEESKKDKYLEKLQNHLQTKHLYRESELSLGDLSAEINIPSHYISQVINERLGTNFLDLINQYRVEDAKVQLSDPEKEHFTIISIAFDSGFNSRSTFYTAFKKHTGMTPSQYKKKMELVNV